MEFNRVINGIVKYLNREVIPNMNEWQGFVARMGTARILNNTDNLKKLLADNVYVKTFAIFDEHGNVDIDGLINDLKTAIKDKGYIEFELPMFGKFKFIESDIDNLHSYIRGA